MRTRTALAVPLVALGMLAATAAPAAAAIDWQIPLHHSLAYPLATGGAQYQAQPGQRELQVEAEHMRALAGQRVVFYANGSRFGTGLVSTYGVAQIDRNTELGQYVPTIVHGSRVTVRTSGGALILSGSF